MNHTYVVCVVCVCVCFKFYLSFLNIPFTVISVESRQASVCVSGHFHSSSAVSSVLTTVRHCLFPPTILQSYTGELKAMWRSYGCLPNHRQGTITMFTPRSSNSWRLNWWEKWTHEYISASTSDNTNHLWEHFMLGRVLNLAWGPPESMTGGGTYSLTAGYNQRVVKLL